jgi:hypothetical protein
LKAEDFPQRLIKAFLPRDLRLKVNRWYKLRTADYFIVSYPKCGRTWLRVILSHYYVERFGLEPGSLLDFANLHYQNREIPRIFFTHYVPNTLISPDDIETQIPDAFRKNPVFLVRDPRDVIVSLYFQRTRRDSNYQGSLSDFVFAECGGLMTLLSYCNLWAGFLPTAENPLLIRYEELRADTPEILARLLRHLGHTPDPEIVRRAVEASSFERMKRLERDNRYNRSWLRAGNVGDDDSFKVRRGKIGGYADYFTDSEIADINRLIRENLAPVFGY